MFDGRLGPLPAAAGQIPLDRYHVDLRAIRTASRVLERRAAVGIFPEGARGAGRADPLPPRRGVPRPGDRGARRAGVVPRHPRAGWPRRTRCPRRGSRLDHGLRRTRPRRRRSPGRAPSSSWPRRRRPLHRRMLAEPMREAEQLTGQCACPARSRTEAARGEQHDRPHRPTRPPDADRTRCRSWPSSAAPTSASPPWSTGSSAAARPSSRTSPGVTRDRVSYDANWTGRAFTVVDTGGWDPDARGLAERIRAQAEIAVDAGRRRAVRRRRDGRHHRRRRGRRPRSCARPASRSCWPPTRSTTSAPRPRPTALWNLGLGEPLPGLGPARPRLGRPARRRSSRRCPSRRRETFERGRRSAPGRDRRQAQRRQVVAAQQAGAARTASSSTTLAGTTVDPVDELVELGGRTWRFIDTAGIRKRVKEASGHEYYASLRTDDRDRARRGGRAGPRRRSQSISEQDVRIVQTVRDAGRALVIAFNKWDLVDEERRYYLDREIERDLVQVQWAPRINITARTGWHVDRLVPAARQGARGLGDPGLDRRAERLPRPARRRAPAPGAQRQAAQDPVRHPAHDVAADVRAVHLRQARRGLRALHRASPARGVRLRRYADRPAAAGPRRSASADPPRPGKPPAADGPSVRPCPAW